jgi:hypothetical protein
VSFDFNAGALESRFVDAAVALDSLARRFVPAFFSAAAPLHSAVGLTRDFVSTFLVAAVPSDVLREVGMLIITS